MQNVKLGNAELQGFPILHFAFLILHFNYPRYIRSTSITINSISFSVP
jgi:hypothetical protein